MSNHLVRLHIPFTNPDTFDELTELEDYLADEVEKSGLGKYDGNEIGQGEFTIWFFGPDGTKLTAAIQTALKSKTLPAESILFVRYGGVADEDAPTERILLDA